MDPYAVNMVPVTFVATHVFLLYASMIAHM